MKLFIGSVVLNGLEYTKQFIHSIQTKYEYELLIVDNNSTDGTADWCKENNINVYRFTPQVSLSKSWNYIIKEALKTDCKYIFIPNNDVIFHKTTIDNLVKAMEETDFAMVTGSNEAPNYSLEDFYNIEKPFNISEYNKEIKNWREEGPDFSCYMIRRDLVEKVGWFDENFFPAYYEDNCYHYRIMLAGLHAKRIFSAPYYHFGSRTSAINTHLGLNSEAGKQEFLKKWGAMPSDCMDGNGYKYPYNDETKTFRYWVGCEYLKDTEIELFGKQFKIYNEL